MPNEVGNKFRDKMYLMGRYWQKCGYAII